MKVGVGGVVGGTPPPRVRYLRVHAMQSILVAQVVIAWKLLIPLASVSLSDDGNSTQSSWWKLMMFLDVVMFTTIMFAVESPTRKFFLLHWFPLISPVFFIICACYFNLIAYFKPIKLLFNPGIFIAVSALLLIAMSLGSFMQFPGGGDGGVDSTEFLLGFVSIAIGNSLMCTDL